MNNFTGKSSKFILFFILLLTNWNCRKATTGHTFFVIGQDTTVVQKNLVHFFETTASKTNDSIQVAKTASWITGQVVYSVMISELKTGDIIVAKGETKGGVTGDFNVAFNGYIILTDGPSKLPGVGISYEISEDNGFNITSDIHYGVMTKYGTYTCQKDFTQKMYVNFCCKAYSSAANPPIDYLKVERDFGQLGVIVYRN